MIKSVEIENLRGIQQGKLDNLTRLVVLVGPNGCGKSTVLDAINIGAHPSLESALTLTLSRQPHEVEPGRWFVHRQSEQAGVRVVTSDNRQRQLKFQRSDASAATSIHVYGGDLDKELGYAVITFNGNVRCDPALKDLQTNGNVIFIDSDDRLALHDLFSQAVRRIGQDGATNLAKSMIPELVRAQILTSNSIPYLYFEFANGGLPATATSEGTRAYLSATWKLAAAKETIVLYEEPEVHLHPRAIWELADSIVATVGQGSQVILSTHSLELIDALVSACKVNRILSELQVVRTKLDGGCLKTVQLSGDDVEFTRERIGDDLR